MFLHRSFTLTAGETELVEINREPGGEFYVAAGNINGGSLAVEHLVGTVDVPYPDSPIIADGGFEFRGCGGVVKLTLTGGGPTQIVIGQTDQPKVK